MSPLSFFDGSLRESAPEDSKKYMGVGNLGYHDYYNNPGSRDNEGYLGDVMWERRCRY